MLEVVILESSFVLWVRFHVVFAYSLYLIRRETLSPPLRSLFGRLPAVHVRPLAAAVHHYCSSLFVQVIAIAFCRPLTSGGNQLSHSPGLSGAARLTCL
jgi:hypothetical protein